MTVEYDFDSVNCPVKTTLIDNGTRKELIPGKALREDQNGKGAMHLLPLDALSLLHNEDKVFSWFNSFIESKNIQYLKSVYFYLIEKYYNNDTSDCIIDLSIHFEEGAKKYAPNNWKKGLPIKSFIDSALRHYVKYLNNHIDEPHLRAVFWNIVCCIWTMENIPELCEDFKNG